MISEPGGALGALGSGCEINRPDVVPRNPRAHLENASRGGKTRPAVVSRRVPMEPACSDRLRCLARRLLLAEAERLALPGQPLADGRCLG